VISFEQIAHDYGYSYEEAMDILKWYDEDLGDTPESLLALFREHEDLVASTKLTTLLPIT
jgi:hypothetical protein